MNDPNACFIDDKCYTNGQTFSNDSFSCLQCQPRNSQDRWSLNPACSSVSQCVNPVFLAKNTCPEIVTKAFYQDPDSAEIDYYAFQKCGQDRQQCQAGFIVEADKQQPLVCCPGFFCPTGQACMIPCRPGSFCPSPLQANNSICETPVKCPEQTPSRYERYGCGGSAFEGFCPTGKFCPTSHSSVQCPEESSYCPIGVIEPLACITLFDCYGGQAHRGMLFRIIIGVVAGFLGVYIIIALVSQSKRLAKCCKGANQRANFNNISRYFQKRTSPNNDLHPCHLNIYLSEAQLRDVTRFDYTRNEGFTGRITAGKITALMGGSGCGKSSLLDTIHGRRRLYSGNIQFANYEPLSNKLTDYIGYVPQADIMHKDLTVFETVYYSARTRRLRHDRNVIKTDVAYVLNKLGLGNMHDNMTETLSGGNHSKIVFSRSY